MRVTSDRVVPVRVLAGVEEQANDLCVPMLGGQCKGAVAVLSIRARKGLARLLDPTGCGGPDEVDLGATPNERIHSLELAVCEGRNHGSVRVGSVVAQEIDERDLNAALP